MANRKRQRKRTQTSAPTAAPSVSAPPVPAVQQPPAVERPPLVSVIVVTYNSCRHLPDLLHSLRAQSFRDFELIVVDSNSSDHTRAVIAAHAPKARVLAATENLGYRRGNQAGMEMARGEYLLILNDDVELHPGMLEALVDAAARNPRAAILAPAILHHGSPERVNAAGSTLVPVGFYSARGKNRTYRQFRNPGEIAAASGCCFLYRRDAFLRIGGFDPLFDTLPSGWHASAEDLDLCWRVWCAGARILYIPDALVWHKYQQKPVTRSRFASLVAGRLAFVAVNYEEATLWRLAPALLATEFALLAYSLSRGWSFVGAWFNAWCWLLGNRRRILELRGVRWAARRLPDVGIYPLMQARLELAPSMSRNPAIRAAAGLWFGLNAVCLGWRR